ncbi:MAG TPA: cutinase family protein, partial [Nocardioidaceae bacterium]|nr:cutinase family protein [Nocardioidaceae bacterium]
MSAQQRLRRALRRPSVLLVVLTLVVAGLIRVLAPGAADVPTASPAAVQESGCADVLFVGVDGRGEAPVPGGFFGPTLTVLHSRYTALTSSSLWSLETRRVSFSGQELSVLKTKARGPADEVVTPRSAKRWARGLSGAATRAAALIRAAAADCPQQQIVLAGYSQGAGAVHRALLELRANRRITERITAAVLVADPDRAGHGVLNRLTTPVPGVPPRGALYPVLNICAKGDVICDFGPTSIREAFRAHNSYRSTRAGALRGVAGKVFVRTTKHPKPSTNPLTLDLEVSRPVRQYLGVDVAAESRPHLRFATRATLPPGVLLSDRGLLSGVPVTPGTWTVLYTVRNTEAPEFSRKVPGFLVIVVNRSGTGTISTGGGQTCP